MAKRLTARQKAFIVEFPKDHNATKAALRAGYSPVGARQAGAQCMSKPAIRKAIDQIQEAAGQSVGITIARTLKELGVVGLSNIENYVVTDDGVELAKGAPPSAMRAVSSVKRKAYTDKDGNITVEVEFKLWDKLEAIQLIGRNLGMFPNKVDVDVGETLLDLLVNKDEK